MNNRKALAVVILTVFIIPILAYSVILVWDIKVPKINPEPEPEYLPIILTYPNSMWTGFENYSCTVSFQLKFNGTISEGSTIEVVNASCFMCAPYNYSVYVGFPYAIDSDLAPRIQTGEPIITAAGCQCAIFRDNFIVNDTTNPFPMAYWHELNPSFLGTFFFPVAGDYSPVIRIFETSPNYTAPMDYSYDQIKVHVLSSSETEALRIGKVNLSLTYAMLGLSFVGLASLFNELLGKDNPQPPIVIKTEPQQNEPTPIVNSEKTKDLPAVQPDSGGKGNPKDKEKDNSIKSSPADNKHLPKK
jgi:hypothetical protein